MRIELCSGGLCAGIESKGAQLVSLKGADGTEYIWQRNPAVWGKCAPILFPVVGRLREGRTLINGMICSLPLHGYCMDSEFRLLDRTEDSVRFFLDHTMIPKEAGNGLLSYPYRFRLIAAYSLCKDGISLSLCVENADERTIEYFIGTHPGFRMPLFSGETISDYRLQFSGEESRGYYAFDTENGQFDMTRELPFPGDGRNIPLCESLFQKDALWFRNVSSRAVRLLNRDGRGVEVEYPEFDTVAFWKLPGEEAQFLCIEPWNGSAPCSDEGDVFSEKNHLQTLKRGEAKSYRMRIRIL